jgi:hypothetical protein
MSQVRATHILVKHKGSRRAASWKVRPPAMQGGEDAADGTLPVSPGAAGRLVWECGTLREDSHEPWGG